jgi:ABC-type transport system involved in cytochrome c biogenesis permease subunit
MASNSLPADASKFREGVSVPTDFVWDDLKAVLAPIASLKLTVVLFTMSIFLIFVGTLAQVDQNMWEIVNNYFHSPLVWIAPEVLMPAPWFPGWPAARIVLAVSVVGALVVETVLFVTLSRAISQRRELGYLLSLGGALVLLFVYTLVMLYTRTIPFPGGLTLGSVMFVNLLAAHAIRFKPQAKGTPLVIGTVVLLIGVLLTWAVISSGHNGEGLQGAPPVSFAVMWTFVKVGLGAIALGLAIGFLVLLSQSADRVIELVVLGVIALIMIALLVWLFVSGWYFGDSGMRILWQLIKAGGVALVLLAGCNLIFKKRGGIVLIHGGIGLMMVGELLVGTFVSEERIMIDEGDSSNYAADIRSTELAIVDSSSSEDDVVVVPLWVKGRQSSLLRTGGVIQHDDLPFDVEVVEYFRNSNLKDVARDADNKATAGKGRRTIAVETRPGSGTDGGEVDMASAYVRFLEKGGSKEIGTYMLSQVVLQDRRGATYVFDEEIPAGGKTYHAAVRFKRTYKPYALRLIDVRKDDYIGTTTPKNYSSDLRLVDASRSVDREVKVWMNNPLRYAGETFYQSGYHLGANGAETTTLQVVRNTGWMIPYVACMLVMTGMFGHFSNVLLRFLRRLSNPPPQPQMPVEKPIVADYVAALKPAQKRRGPKRKRPTHDEPVELAGQPRTLEAPSITVTASIAVAIVLLFGVWLVGKVRPAKVADGEMNVPGFGALPLVYEGRVKPIDTLARNSLRVISTKEQLKVGDDKEPATRWLLDVISGSKAGEKRRVFRIDNLEVVETFKLTRRKGNLYSYEELHPQMEEYRKQVGLANSVDPAELSIYQRKVLELDTKLQLFFKLREAFRTPEDDLKPAEEASYLNGMASVSQELSDAPVPYALPVEADGEKAWEPLVAGVTRLWAKDLADRHGVDTARGLAVKLAAPLTEILVENRLVENIKTVAGAESGLTGADLEAYARNVAKDMPADMRQRFTADIRTAPDIVSVGRRIETNLTFTIDNVLGKDGLSYENRLARSMWNMLAAYRDEDAGEFNDEIQRYKEELVAAAPADLNVTKTNFEAFFNHFAPFYNCAALYVVAFVLTAVGWMAWPFRWNKPFNWAAFGLIALTLVVHTIALGARIYISGRPPVTNLYSSAIYIGWAAVLFGLVLELILRLGIGNAVSAVAGFSTLVIAHQLAGDGDTFTVLQAVLDTQFWLATHVVSITTGYAATFVAGLLGIVFILAGLFTPVLSFQVGEWNVRKLLANMIYGVVCFALFFSFLGTVLGGLWADDSWGRFWGWDPKENGALIIVIWNAIVLHARWGGIIRDRGLAMAAIFGNVVTSWSWFGVNELGVGLHSYGFTEGVLPALIIFACSQFFLIALGAIPKTMWWSFAEEKRTASGNVVTAQAV